MSETMIRSRSREATAPAPEWFCSLRITAGGAGWVDVAGELTAGNASDLERTLRCAVDRAPVVVLDLRKLESIDRSGLSVVVDVTLRARDLKRRVIIVRGREQVDRMFALSGASEQVEIGDLDTPE